MKRYVKRGVLFLLALVLAMPQVLASDALGSDRKGRTTELTAGVTVTDNSLWSATYSDLRTEHYITYRPGSAVTPVVVYGSKVSDSNTLSSAAAKLEAQGYRVVGGINGGFFNTDGTTVGLLMTDGIIRSLDEHNYDMVGFAADGTAFVDSSQITKTVRWANWLGGMTELPLTAINASRDDGGLYLFNRDFGASMGNTLGGVDVVLAPVLGGELRMNSTLTFRVTQVRDSTAEGAKPDNSIPEGSYVLSANRNCSEELLGALRSLTVGTQVTLELSGADSRWSSAVYGLSALYRLVENGGVNPSLPTGAAPRTAIGIRADGTLIFYTIDGRQSGYSVGASYTQTAQRLVELGCVTAVALDGGGSTTLGVTLPGSDSFTVLNSPSGVSERKVSNCVLLVTAGSGTGALDRVFVDTQYDVVLTGGQTRLTAAGADALGYPAGYGGTPVWSSDGGSVGYDAEGAPVFTAGNRAGSYEISASVDGAAGSAPVRVVDTLSKLTVTRGDTGNRVETLLTEPGELVELDASGLWYNIPVGMDDTDVVWTADGAIGEVDENGLFRAGAENGEGTLTAAAGGRTVTISVKVDRGDPFTDITGHWSQSYVTKLYKLSITTGSLTEDGTYIYQPDSGLTRGQLLVFITRMLDVDVEQYMGVELPFADADAIPEWMLPAVKAMYSLQVFSGSQQGGKLYANVYDNVTREAAMTMLGRVLAQPMSYDLSVFKDGGQVSQWASFYVQSLVAHGVVGGSGGYLYPAKAITRGEIAKILTLVSQLPHAEMALREGVELQTVEN